MDQLYEHALSNMEQTLHSLAGRVPAPQEVPFQNSFVYRYIQKTIHQALVQKLARLITGLRAARLVCDTGLFQEQAALQRILDEFHEDILFLACGAIYDVTPLHEEYLAAFFEEEFDKDTALKSTQKRPMVSRRKIRAHLAQLDAAPLDPSRAIELSRTLHKTYSGYVHGASPHIMDMYGGDPPHFHVRGMLRTPREQDHRWDLWNYFYRSILSFAFVAKAFGDDKLFNSIREYRDEFEQTSQGQV